MGPPGPSGGGESRPARIMFWLTAVWSGATVMAFELAGARLLMPTFGMGVGVWAAVIATTLGALAIGYSLGGRLADRWPRGRTLAGVLAMAGIALVLVRLFGPCLPNWFLSWPFTAGAWGAAAALQAPGLIVLGMVQPMLARLLIRDHARTGRTVGSLLALSTLGGVSGTALAAIVLMPRLGVSDMLLAMGAGTILLAGVMAWVARSRAVAMIALVLAGVATGSRWIHVEAPAPGPMKVLEEVEGRYGRLEILEYRGVVTLACNGVFQAATSGWGPGVMPGGLIQGRDYIELIPYFRPGAQRALLIGLGGGLHVQALRMYGIDTHSVEIEPAVVELAEAYFGFAGEVTIADGRAFLARGGDEYDAIIIDTFVGGTAPEHLYTREAFERVDDRLTPGGLLAIHLIGPPQHPAVQAIARTAEMVFDHVTAARSGYGDGMQQIYLFASQNPLEISSSRRDELVMYGFTGDELYQVETAGARILTDDQTNLALLSRPLAIEHRRLCSAKRRQPPW